MPLQAQRVLNQFKYAMYFNGINAYVNIPLTVYGWPGITIQEWIYFYKPKANTSYSRSSMIGDRGTNSPCIQWVTDNRIDYAWIWSQFFVATPSGTAVAYTFDISSYVNVWTNFVRRYDNSSKILSHFVNSIKANDYSIPSNYTTIFDFDPNTYTYPDRYKIFILGTNTIYTGFMTLMQYQLLIYSRSLSDSEIQYNYQNPNNPVTNGLIVWLQADPKYIRGNTWLNLSSYGNNGTIYNAQLIQLEKTPARILNANRVLGVLR